MTAGTDISTVDLTRTRVRLRNDLKFVPQQYGSDVFYHIEVPAEGQYYRVGYREYVLISLLDGRTSFSQALAIASQVLGADAVSQSEAMVIYSWLLDHGLSSFVDQPGLDRSTGADHRGGALLKRLNPLYFRISFGCPEFLLKAVQPLAGWLFSVPATLMSCVLYVIAALLLHHEWSRFSAASGTVFAPDNWLWLLLAWILLKVLHETAHAVVCMKYGGAVGDTGIIFAFLAPLPFVDASSCWSFRSRWQRIHTAAAGVYIELLIAALAVIWWYQCRSPEIRHLLQNVVVMASISTLLFNLNPLMRFDGYFVLSDLLQIPNLSSESSSTVSALFRRVLLGDISSAPVNVGRRSVLICYGLAAAVWRFIVSLTLLITASVMFHGAGMALALTGVLIWFARPLWHAIQVLVEAWRQTPARVLRASLASGTTAAAICTVLFRMTAPVAVLAPGIVEYTDGQTVRATTSGFVREVLVRDGQEVRAGDLLLVLENEDVTGEHWDLEQQIQQEEVRIHTATRGHESGAISIAQANLESLRQRMVETQKKVDGLQLHALHAGKISGSRLQQLEDTFVQEGQELLTIGNEDSKELRISVLQNDLPTAMRKLNKPLGVRIGTRPGLQGHLVRINPKATRKLPHPALAATSGGTLAVTETSDSEKQLTDGELVLTEQRFDAVISLDPDVAADLCCGERGVVTIGSPDCSVAVYLYRTGYRWIENHIAAAGFQETAANFR
jgi:putative peptide zinc metalloprotease protein